MDRCHLGLTGIDWDFIDRSLEKQWNRSIRIRLSLIGRCILGGIYPDGSQTFQSDGRQTGRYHRNDDRNGFYPAICLDGWCDIAYQYGSVFYRTSRSHLILGITVFTRHDGLGKVASQDLQHPHQSSASLWGTFRIDIPSRIP